jgi:hypothetical protein
MMYLSLPFLLQSYSLADHLLCKKFQKVTFVAPLMEKWLTQTGVWIRFDSALSDPVLCTVLCLAWDVYVYLHVYLLHCHPKKLLKQEARRSEYLYFC